ncbi:hypothetical protein EGW08_002140, partial [Elysia chlorotica]
MDSTKLCLLIASTMIALGFTFPMEQKVTFAYPYSNPDENRGNNAQFLEGDIVIDKDMQERIYEERTADLRSNRQIGSAENSPKLLSRKRRNADFKFYDTWYTRIIPYTFDKIFQS